MAREGRRTASGEAGAGGRLGGLDRARAGRSRAREKSDQRGRLETPDLGGIREGRNWGTGKLGWSGEGKLEGQARVARERGRERTSGEKSR